MSFIERWKRAEKAVGQWLAETVTGTIVKTAIAPVLIWVGDNVADWNLSPVVVVAIIAVAPAIINAINASDPRYGRGSGE